MSLEIEWGNAESKLEIQSAGFTFARRVGRLSKSELYGYCKGLQESFSNELVAQESYGSVAGALRERFKRPEPRRCLVVASSLPRRCIKTQPNFPNLFKDKVLVCIKLFTFLNKKKD